jgi:hypothetical protein
MSEGIEKKCINIEKKSINKIHSYSISIYIDGMGHSPPPLFFYIPTTATPPQSSIVTTTHESGVIVSQGVLIVPISTLTRISWFPHVRLNSRMTEK